MAHYDLREFLERLDAAQELHHVRPEIDPVLELGAIAQRLAERGGPSAHFWNVRGAPAGLSYVAGLLGRGQAGLWSRLAIALELDPALPYAELLAETCRRRESSIRPIQVGGGPVKSQVVEGEAVDLNAYAAPLLHPTDGGRCLVSWGFTIVQEPDTGFVAWELLPFLIASDHTLLAHLPRDSQVGRIHARCAGAGQHMSFAIVLGGSPVLTLAAAARLKRTDAVAPEVAGALQREPVQLVKCETSTLLVPAAAEMVLEGVVRPGEMAPIGPFPSTFGYQTPAQAQSPIFKVTTITHRDKPVLPVCAWGTPTADIHIARGLDSDVNLKLAFEKRGAPVQQVFTPPWLAGSLVALTTRVPYTAYAQAAAGIVRSVEATHTVPYILVCDDDIDITNPVSLFHAMVTKCHPARDTWIVKSTVAAHDAPYLSARERTVGHGSAAIFDCTWPLDWDKSVAVPPKVSFTECYPTDLQEKVLADWTQGLKFPPEHTRPA